MTDISVIPSTDAALLHRLMTDPSIYDAIADDGSPPVDEFQISNAFLARSLFVICYVRGAVVWTPAAFAIFEPLNHSTVSYHGGVLPHFRSYSNQMGRQVFSTLFAGTGFTKIIATTPSRNAAARSFNSQLGMVREGLIRDSYMKNGVVDDLIVYGMTARKWHEKCDELFHQGD